MPAERAGVRPPLAALAQCWRDLQNKVHSYHVSRGHISAHGHPQDSGAAWAQRRDDFKDNNTPRTCTTVRQTKNTRHGLLHFWVEISWADSRLQIFNGRKTEQCGVIIFGSEGAFDKDSAPQYILIARYQKRTTLCTRQVVATIMLRNIYQSHNPTPRL